MPTVKITNPALRAMLPSPEPGKQILYWDSDLAGFGVRIAPGGKMTYIVQRDVKGKTRRISLGPLAPFPLSDARNLAQEEIGNMLRGIDPVVEKRKIRASSFTLGAALDYYLEKNRELREKTKKDFRSTIEKNLSTWLSTSLREIDRDMVEKRHNDIQREVAARGRSTGREGITGEWVKKVDRCHIGWNGVGCGVGDDHADIFTLELSPCPLNVVASDVGQFRENFHTDHPLKRVRGRETNHPPFSTTVVQEHILVRVNVDRAKHLPKALEAQGRVGDSIRIRL